MEMKHLAFPIEEMKADDETRTIEGWVSVFNNVDSGKDIILPGAFAKTLANRKASDKVVLLWQHDTREPIGVWHDLKEIDRGLYGKAEIFDTARGIDAYKLAKGGAVKGLSIGYSPKQYEIDQKKGVRKLAEVDLYEASLVTFPMNQSAQVTRVKSRPENERELEQYLREAGYSLGEAKGLIAKGYKAIAGQREVDCDPLITSMNNAINILKG